MPLFCAKFCISSLRGMPRPSGVELRAYFSFAQLNGMETEEQWVSKWEINRRRAGKRLLD
jgi:hypothetical protein